MGRSPCCSREGLKKGAWTPLEDKTLTDYITTHGEGKWRSLPERAGLKRCGKSCRLRWLNYLRPDIKRGKFTPDEEDLIIRLHKLLGNRWSLIAGRLPGRTDNEIKNYWNTHIGRKIHFQQTHSSTSNIHLPSIQSKKKSSSSSSTVVVRSKATRCSETFIKSPQQLDTPTKTDEAFIEPLQLQPQLQQTDNKDSGFQESKAANDDDINFMMDYDDSFLSSFFDNNEVFMRPPPPRFDYNASFDMEAAAAAASASTSSNPYGLVHGDECFNGMFHGTQLGSINMISPFDTTCTTTNMDWMHD